MSMVSFHKAYEEIVVSQAYFAAKIANLIGILKSASEAIDLGLLNKIEHILYVDIFHSLNDQARFLLKEKLKIPAAVLGRIIIERWLTNLAEQNSLPIKDDSKASTINDNLKQNKIFSTPKWRLVSGFLDVGNSAAHGKDTEFDDNDVENMLKFIEDNCN